VVEKKKDKVILNEVLSSVGQIPIPEPGRDGAEGKNLRDPVIPFT